MKVQWVESMVDVAASDWNTLVDSDMPFLRHAFLNALESSLSVAADQGWRPLHACVYEGVDLLAVAPGYIKNHSYGEYVFDWSWADAYQRHGISYYPKYVTAIPFTPVVGARLLMRPEHQNDAGMCSALHAHYAEAVIEVMELHGCSSWHVLFARDFAPAGNMVRREGTQFHWFNAGYESFDGFLAHLSSSRRKSIRKERKRCHEQGLVFHWCAGAALSVQEQAHFYRCYASTYGKRGQLPYLTPAFFNALFKELSEQVEVLLIADKHGEQIAAALFLKGSETLYGRYWGCLQEVPGLHFEACYYQGIERCIALGLKRFDAGAQGEHKLLRGFEPVTTYSYHWLSHPGFAEAVANFVAEEAEHVASYQQQARSCLPFRKNGT